MRTLLAVLAFLAVTSVAGGARADGDSVRYVGIHPIPAEYGGGFCYIEYPHVHVFTPQRPDILYRRHDEGYHFVGDPIPYGYEGPKQAYYGPHPMVVDDDGSDPEWCYLEGPHYHPYAPAPEARFKLKGGVYFYAGNFPRVYSEARPRYAKINAVYRPFHYARPVVVVSPPPEYTGPVYVESEPSTVVVGAVAPTVVVPATVGVGVGMHAEAGIGFHAGIGAGVAFGVAPPPPVMVVREHPAPVVIVRDQQPTYIVHERPVQVIEVKGKKWKEHDEGWHGRGHEKRGWH